MNEPLAVVFQRRATREIEAIDRWWRENRSAAPDLFLHELEKMLAIVALVPTIGAPAKSERMKSIRRVLLRRTQHHVYYRVRGNALEVLAVWHTARRSGPPL
jgi:plasmid stabilization system protein ParE